jgi:uncharacterized membrane protein YfcA
MPIRCLLIPVAFWVGWIVLMLCGNRWQLFADGWHMSVTMCFGSFIAGATSEGGGAVAFPVMTLLFNISPSVARDFSLMIQSVGMTAATLLILLTRTPVEWRAILFAGLGGAAGIVIMLEVIAPLLPPAYVKMFFTSLWLSFGVALYGINRTRNRIVAHQIESFGISDALMLTVIGMIGGLVSGLTGSGLDILTFTLLTLYFRVSEKVATPTSVILMASNALVGFFWCGVVRHRIAAEAWDYWYVCIPVVVLGAPLGAYFIRQRTRHFIARLLYFSIIAQFVGALLVVPQSQSLIIFSSATISVGILAFSVLSVAGARRLIRGRDMPKIATVEAS